LALERIQSQGVNSEALKTALGCSEDAIGKGADSGDFLNQGKYNLLFFLSLDQARKGLTTNEVRQGMMNLFSLTKVPPGNTQHNRLMRLVRCGLVSKTMKTRYKGKYKREVSQYAITAEGLKALEDYRFIYGTDKTRK
jgi:DNA-binding PadR family transcriptional regulator